MLSLKYILFIIVFALISTCLAQDNIELTALFYGNYSQNLNTLFNTQISNFNALPVSNRLKISSNVRVIDKTSLSLKQFCQMISNETVAYFTNHLSFYNSEFESFLSYYGIALIYIGKDIQSPSQNIVSLYPDINQILVDNIVTFKTNYISYICNYENCLFNFEDFSQKINMEDGYLSLDFRYMTKFDDFQMDNLVKHVKSLDKTDKYIIIDLNNSSDTDEFLSEISRKNIERISLIINSEYFNLSKIYQFKNSNTKIYGLGSLTLTKDNNVQLNEIPYNFILLKSLNLFFDNLEEVISQNKIKNKLIDCSFKSKLSSSKYSSIMISIKKNLNEYKIPLPLWNYNGLSNRFNEKRLTTNILRVTTLLTQPFVKKIDGKFTGIFIDLVKSMATDLNMDLEIQECADSRYGMKSSDGKWNGMIGELVDDKADLALAPFQFSASRAEVVFYTRYLHSTNLSMIFNPDKMSEISNIKEVSGWKWLNVFESSVWICYFVFGLLVAALLCISSWINPLHCQPQYNKERFYWIKQGSFALATMVKWPIINRYRKGPSSTGSRIILSFWWIFCYVFFVYYLVALLKSTLFSVEDKFTVNQLVNAAERKEIKIGVIDRGSIMKYLLGTSKEYLKTIGELIRDDSSMNTNQHFEGVSRANNDNYAYIAEDFFIEYFKETVPEFCNLQVLTLIEKFSNFAFVVNKRNEKLFNKINDYLMRLFEYNKYSIMAKIKSKSVCSIKNPNTKIRKEFLNLSNLYGVFLLLFVILVLSLLIVLGEWFYIKSINQRQKPKSSINSEEVNIYCIDK